MKLTVVNVSFALAFLFVTGCSEPGATVPPVHESPDAMTQETISEDLRNAIDDASGEIRVDGAAVAPRFEFTNSPRLVLPTTYAAAVEDYDPQFQPWNISAFPEWASETSALASTSRQALFAVIGDFNGDSQADVVVDGHGADYTARIVLMSDGPGTRLIEHERGELYPNSEMYRGQIGIVLDFVPPGHYENPFNDAPLVLTTDAFELVYLEKAAAIFYWKDGAFERWQSAD